LNNQYVTERKEVIPVKKVLSLLSGMVFVLAVGMAYADDMMPGKGTGEKMIHDEDLQKYDQDRGQSTVNQMPSVPGAEGSAPGGSGDSDSKQMDDTYEKPAPADQGKSNPPDTGRSMEDRYKDQDTYR
jgi:hypothetical protein